MTPPPKTILRTSDVSQAVLAKVRASGGRYNGITRLADDCHASRSQVHRVLIKLKGLRLIIVYHQPVCNQSIIELSHE